MCLLNVVIAFLEVFETCRFFHFWLYVQIEHIIIFQIWLNVQIEHIIIFQVWLNVQIEHIITFLWLNVQIEHIIIFQILLNVQIEHIIIFQVWLNVQIKHIIVFRFLGNFEILAVGSFLDAPSSDCPKYKFVQRALIATAVGVCWRVYLAWTSTDKGL